MAERDGIDMTTDDDRQKGYTASREFWLGVVSTLVTLGILAGVVAVFL